MYVLVCRVSACRCTSVGTELVETCVWGGVKYIYSCEVVINAYLGITPDGNQIASM